MTQEQCNSLLGYIADRVAAVPHFPFEATSTDAPYNDPDLWRIYLTFIEVGRYTLQFIFDIVDEWNDKQGRPFAASIIIKGHSLGNRVLVEIF